MRVSVFKRPDVEMTDTYLRQMTALGVDCLDFGHDTEFPGVEERGIPDLEELVRIRKRIRSFGMDINRVTLPNLSPKFMQDLEGGAEELENACRALEVYARPAYR